jgi:hypothetical protein
VQQNPANGFWEVTKPYTDATELHAVSKEIKTRQDYAAAFNKGAANVMAMFGHSPEDYYRIAKERKEKTNAAKVVPAPASTTVPDSTGDSTDVGSVEGQ